MSTFMSYSFCNSTLLLQLEMAIFITCKCWLDDTIWNSTQQTKFVCEASSPNNIVTILTKPNREGWTMHYNGYETPATVACHPPTQVVYGTQSIWSWMESIHPS